MNQTMPRSSGRTLCGFSFLVLMAVTALATTGGPAYAGEDDDRPKIAVSYGDLNLGNEGGVKALYGRLTGAAKAVCPRFDRRLLAQRAKWDQCYEQALSAAVVDVNDPGLSTMHSRRHGTLTHVEVRTVRARVP